MWPPPKRWRKPQKLIYRAHDEPSREKLSALSEFLATIGVKFAKGQTVRAAQFNAILAKVKGLEHENLVNEIVLRTQAQAEYTTKTMGISGSTCAATHISPRRSGAMPISSCIAR